MKHHDQVADAFGTTAAAYLTSTVHATGADLQTLADAVSATPDAAVLDLGSRTYARSRGRPSGCRSTPRRSTGS